MSFIISQLYPRISATHSSIPITPLPLPICAVMMLNSQPNSADTASAKNGSSANTSAKARTS